MNENGHEIHYRGIRFANGGRLKMGGVDDFSEELSKQVLEIPPMDRGKILRAAISFTEFLPLSESLAVGPLRSAFADWWFQNFKEAIPIVALRELLQSPTSISLAQQFALLKHCSDKNDVMRTLRQLASQLKQQLQKRSTQSCQLSLFPQRLENLRLASARPFERPKKKAGEVGNCVSSLEKLVRDGAKFSTIYADPPWPYRNKASRAAAENHYPTLSLDEIKAEPVSNLVNDNAHLHLWTTNAFLRESFEVMEAWDFKFKSCLLWIKPNFGLGNYWRVSHEFLCLGVRGKLTFADRTLPSWLLADRTIHSRKPRQFREFIERVSQPPFLELYGREVFPGTDWTVYGNQIEQLLF